MLIEGVHLLPGLRDLDRYREPAHVINMGGATLDEEAWGDRFQQRASVAKERAAERYLHHLAEIRLIQNHILHEADHYELPIIDNVHLDDAVLSAIRSVISTLRKSMADEVPTS